MDLSFDLSNILGLLATLTVLTGIFLVVIKRRFGFLLCSAGNMAWLISELRNEEVDFWFLVTCVVFTSINTYGWFRWKNHECDSCARVKAAVDDVIEHTDSVSDELKESRE